MQINPMILMLVSVIAITTLANAEDSAGIRWPKGTSAVAWKTKKKMFLVKNVEPVGLNTSIRIFRDEVTKTISISIPIDKFDSGEPARDKEVVKILKGDIQPDLLFRSEVITDDLEKSILQSQFSGTLTGELKIGGKSFKVTFAVKKGNDGQQEFLDGELPTTFTAFEIKPPTVAGGLIARVRDELTLFFRIYLVDIKT